jgi:hypothetical protein
MSSNRLLYDPCEYTQKLHESVSSANFVLDPVKYEHVNKCRHEFGLLGGTNVSHVAGNLVDLENDLRGQTRPMTKCSGYKYTGPSPDGAFVPGKEYIKPVVHPKIDTSLRHLPSCQMIHYQHVPNVSLARK